MAKDRDNVLSEFEALKRDTVRVVDGLAVIASDLDQTWEALREVESALGKLNKEVATSRALSPYTRKYARTHSRARGRDGRPSSARGLSWRVFARTIWQASILRIRPRLR